MTTASGRVNPWIVVVGLLITAPLVAVLYSGFGKDPKAVPFALDGKPAPQIQLVDLDGNAFDLAQHRGKPVVLNFWSTWCQPCKIEHPLLVRAPSMYPDVTFLGVIYSDEPSAARRYLKTAGTSYPHLVDEQGRTAIDYGVAGVPETFFISTDGTLVKKHVGALSPASLAAAIHLARGGS